MDDGACQSSSSNVWLLKFWAPLFWLIWTVALFKDDVFSIRIIACIPFVLAFVFHISLAIVRIRDGRVEYRQFLQWKPLPSTDVVSSGVVWSPFIGFLRLRKPQPPWGRLFFVLDPESTRRSSRQAGLGIVGYLSQERGTTTAAINTADEIRGVRYGRLLAAAVCGILASFLRVYLSQTVAPDTTEPTKYGSRLVDSATRALAYVGNPQFAIPLLVGFVLLTIFLRNRTSAWSFAFLAGVVAPFVFCAGLMR
jgi:hypothetical protein